MTVNIAKGKVFTGARARIILNGAPIGYATRCSGGETITYEAAKVIDALRTVEFVPVDYDCSMQASYMRLIDSAGVGSIRTGGQRGGIFPKAGKSSDEHLDNVLSMDPDMNALIEDSRSQSKFMLMENMVCSSRNWDFGKGIVGEDVTLLGTVIHDELGT